MRISVFLCFLVLLIGTGCGGESETNSGSSDDVTTTPGKSNSAAVANEADACVRAKKVLVESLNDGMSDEEASVSNVYVVQAEGLGDPPLNGFNDGAFVAAGEVNGGEADGAVAAWVVDKDMTTIGGGAVFAIDDAAQEISHFGADIGEGSVPAEYMDKAKNSEAYAQAVDCVG